MTGTRNRGRGELEAEVLAVLRRHAEPIGAGDVQAAFAEPTPAYTTVLTVLDRLIEKGEVVRHAESPRKVKFAAARTADESASLSMRRALEGSGDRTATLLRFAGELDTDDLELLRAAMAKKRRTP